MFPRDCCILIVDDEEALLGLMSSYLARLGFQTLPFTNASEALAEFRRDPGRYSVLIADLSLPDLEGDQMALQMVELNPALRVLLCSGYPFDPVSLPEAVREQFEVLQKPFLPNRLAECIARLAGGNQT